MGEFNVGRKGYLGCWHMDWVLKEQEFFFWLKSRIYWWVCLRRGRPRWLSGKESTWQFRKHRRRGFNPWVRMIPWSRKQQPTPIFLPGKFHGERSLVGYSPWGHKESDMTERLSIPHFLILGWPKSSFGFFCKILWKNLSELFDQANVF